ncbi:MAG: hypothetical protein ABID84_05220, partial [Chloroflexota bacterium]
TLLVPLQSIAKAVWVSPMPSNILLLVCSSIPEPEHFYHLLQGQDTSKMTPMVLCERCVVESQSGGQMGMWA